MYSIKAQDGNTYGPVDLATMERWVGEGRVVPDTVVIDHVTDIQGPAMSFPLIARYFQGAPSSAGGQTYPPPGAAPYAQNPYQNPPGVGGYPRQPNMGMNPYGGAPQYYYNSPPKQKIVAGLLALFLGALGIHQFYLGKNGLGVAMLLITVLTCGWGGIITGIWALIDTVMIFTGSTTDAAGQPLV